jgi:hypothetical protein
LIVGIGTPDAFLSSEILIGSSGLTSLADSSTIHAWIGRLSTSQERRRVR